MLRRDIIKDELCYTYEPSYFSIEDIVASQVNIRCETMVDIRGFGFLDPSNEQNHLPKGSTVELPVWAVQMMAKPTRRYVKPRTPVKYTKYYRDIIKAEPKIIDLNKWGPHYYHTGVHIACLNLHDRLPIREILVFLLRYRLESMSLTYHFQVEFEDTEDYIPNYRPGDVIQQHQMDALESYLFEDAKNAARRFRRWELGISRRRDW